MDKTLEKKASEGRHECDGEALQLRAGTVRPLGTTKAATCSSQTGATTRTETAADPAGDAAINLRAEAGAAVVQPAELVAGRLTPVEEAGEAAVGAAAVSVVTSVVPVATAA